MCLEGVSGLIRARLEACNRRWYGATDGVANCHINTATLRDEEMLLWVYLLLLRFLLLLPSAFVSSPSQPVHPNVSSMPTREREKVTPAPHPTRVPLQVHVSCNSKQGKCGGGR